ncbi:MAG: hypothetical protein INH34_17475 [Phycisphaerales bacterium]|jgi:translation initiation factor 2B subunit (eIF-2B alpha/beta/delta family)|nr:hypothetical protein [Phycisphaerales bacterium]
MMRLALVVLCLLAGCSRSGSSGSGPKIDATTQESFTQSLRVLAEGLGEEQRREVAMVVLVRVLKVAIETKDADAARRTLHGMNAKQLLAAAAQLPAVPR